MRLVIQRVNHASVKVDGDVIGKIDKGLLIFLGVADGDTREMVDKYVKKLQGLRIFEDADGKTNLSIKDVDGEILVVSQFTLYADCKKETDRVLSKQAHLILPMDFMNILKKNVRRHLARWNVAVLAQI